MNIIELGKDNSDIIMLLHGGGLSWWHYRSESELLSRDYHVVLPILDGHAGSDDDFISIEETARKLVDFIDEKYNGHILILGGTSLGAQIVIEMMAQKNDICDYAIIESASVIPSRLTHALIGTSIAMSYGLIQKKWFAKLQFKYLRINNDLFDDYYRDTSKITKKNMISFLKANTGYKLKDSFKDTKACTRIVAGGKEQRLIRKSAKLLHDCLPESKLEIKKGLYHGEYSINNPEMYVDDLKDMMHF